MRRNPCWNCEASTGGCGKHAECEKYRVFFAEGIKEGEQRKKEGILNDYMKKEVKKAKDKGRHNTYKKYRPQGRSS